MITWRKVWVVVAAGFVFLADALVAETVRQGTPPYSPGTDPRRQIHRKLDSIFIDHFALPAQVELREVLKELTKEIRRRDSSGINFILSNAYDRGSGPTNAIVDIEKFRVQFSTPIESTTVRHFLETLIRVARPAPEDPQHARLRHSVHDHGVVFSIALNDASLLYTRTYKLDPNTFRQGLEGVNFSANPFQGVLANNAQQNQSASGGGSFRFTSNSIPQVTAQTNNIALQQDVRAFFAAAGVNLPLPQPGSPATQKSLFYNDRAGMLVVRGTLDDLDLVEAAIRTLNGRR